MNTGVWLGAGTTANVSFIIHGVDGNSGTINIYQDGTAGSKTILTRGSTQTFTMTLKEHLGDIYSLQ